MAVLPKAQVELLDKVLSQTSSDYNKVLSIMNELHIKSTREFAAGGAAIVSKGDLDDWMQSTTDEVCAGLGDQQRHYSEQLKKMLCKAKFQSSGQAWMDELDMSYEFGGTSGLRKLLVISAKEGDEVRVAYQAYGYEWTEQDTWRLLPGYWEDKKTKLLAFAQHKSAKAIKQSLCL